MSPVELPPGPVTRRLGPSWLYLDAGGFSGEASPIAKTLGPLTIRQGMGSAEPGLAETTTATFTVEWLTDPALGQWRVGAEPGPMLAVDDVVELRLGVDLAVALFGDPMADPVELAADYVWRRPDLRFQGRVTDLKLPQTPDGPREAVVVAVGTVTNALRAVIGDEPWPIEDDFARYDRMLTAGRIRGYTLDEARGEYYEGAPMGPGSYELAARDVDAQPLGTLLDEVAQDGRGRVITTRINQLAYQPATWRARTVTPRLTLTPSQVLTAPEWSQSVDDVLHELTVKLGDDELAPEVTVTELTRRSYDPGQRRSSTITTEHADLEVARAYARDVVGRKAAPLWVVDKLAVRLDRLDLPTLADALDVLPGDLVKLDPLPPGTPDPDGLFWVDSIEETASRKAWTLTLNVSTFSATGTPVRIADLPAVALSRIAPIHSILGLTSTVPVPLPEPPPEEPLPPDPPEETP